MNALDANTRAKISALLELLDGDADRLVTLALRFLYRNPNVTSVLAGSKNAAHVRKNLEMLELDIDESLIDQAIHVT
jgi:aryl-alcohol dehydrogenase-like predicted oxidoreductase